MYSRIAKTKWQCAFTAYIPSWDAPFRMMCPIECILSDLFTFPPCFCHEVMEKCSLVAEVTLHTYVKIGIPPRSVVYISSRSRPPAIADLALHAFFRQSAPVCRYKNPPRPLASRRVEAANQRDVGHMLNHPGWASSS